ncbi:hypothetical protein DYU11_24215 [Fibrisoma montanum]|uniref:SV2A/B/C luminal domain-containing protein n=1 Tax=Fibrisoma montanum TaxID=2305895 RepID=A0A418M2V4_9BACT|nr:pentapeptide repeat-containing protein [Fibrisoma montanum]RIV20018.1 hypothetical protein DYU11_24215 [Fibrisoma montanum]
MEDISQALINYETFIQTEGNKGERTQLDRKSVKNITIENLNLSCIGSAYATFQNVTLRKVDLYSAHLNESVFNLCVFQDITLIKTVMHGAIFNNCQFKNCDFTRAEVIEAKIYGSLFEECNFSGIIFCESTTKDSRFINIKTNEDSVIVNNEEINVVWA